MGKQGKSFVVVTTQLFLILFISSIVDGLGTLESVYYQDKLATSSDLITQELFEKYSDIDPKKFWQPYSFSSEDSSREVVGVESVEKRYVQGNFIQWKYARVGFYHYVIGITQNSIQVFGANFQKITSIISSTTILSFTVFSRWNFESSSPEVLIPVGTTQGIEIYKFENNLITKVDDGWPLQYEIQTLYYAHFGASIKLVIVPAQPNLPVNIYNLAINKTGEVWYHQRLPVTGESHVAVFDLSSESYIAIGSGNSIIVYGYDTEKGAYTVQQTISLVGVVKQLVTFSIAYKRYLASVPGDNSYVEFFGYNGYQFIKEDHPIAEIQTTELHALSVEDYRDEHFLLSKKSDGEIQILGFDGNKFTTANYECSKNICSTDANLDNGVGFTVNGTSYYILPASKFSSQSEVLVITKTVEEALSPIFKQSTDLIDDLKTLFQRFNRWEGVVTRVKKTLEDSVSRVQSNIVTGFWQINQLSSQSVVFRQDSGSEEIDQITIGSFIFFGLAWFDVDFKTNYGDIDERILTLMSNLAESYANLKDSIPIKDSMEGRVHLVTGQQYVTGKFSTTTLVSNNIQTTAINSVDNLSNFLSSVVLKENTIQVESSVEFNGHLTILNLFTETLNRIKISDIAQLGKTNEFHYDVEFTQLLTIDGNIFTNFVNGLDFSEKIIRVTDISDVKFVDGLVALKKATLVSPIDSILIRKEFFDKILLRSTAQKINIPFSFTDIRVEGSVKVTILNGENFSDFVGTIITDDYIGLIRGQKIVTGTITSESLFIQEKLNLYKFPDDLVTTSQKRLIISGYKNFDQLTAGKVQVDGLVDGISTNEVVSRLDYETLRSIWTFEQGVLFLDDLNVKSFVDGVKMDRLRHMDTLDQYKSSYYPDADIEFLQPLYFKNLRVDETINDKNFTDIFGGLLSFDSREMVVKGMTTFQKSIIVNDILLTLGLLNNRIKLDDIFTLSSAQNVTGSKIFSNEINFASLYALETFDSVKLSNLLDNAFRLSKPRTISSLLFFDEIISSKMTVEGPINSFKDFSLNVAVTNGRSEQVFQTSVDISNFTAENLIVTGNLEVGRNKIGGLDFNSWIRRRISLTKDLSISSPVEILGNVKSRGSIQTTKINGIALNYLNWGVLRSDHQFQTFTNTFETNGPIRVENGTLLFESELSGYELERIKKYAIPLHQVDKSVTVTGDWSFENLVVTDELTVGVKTCGVDLDKLNVDLVRKGESDIIFYGDMTFLSEIEVKVDLDVTLVNSEDLFAVLFLLNSTQFVSAPFHFGGSVQVDGELLSSGYINNISLVWLASIYAFENGTTHILKSDSEVAGTLESNSLNVFKFVQEKDFNKFLLSIIKGNAEVGVHITGHKTFTQPITINANMEVQTINEILIERLLSIFLKSDILLLKNSVTFTSTVEAPTLRIVFGDLNTEGLVGDFNLTELMEGAAYLNSEKSLGVLSFQSILVKGDIKNVKFLNGVLLEDVIRLDNSNQRIGSLNIKNVTLSGRNVVVGGLVSGYNILKEYENTLFKNSKRSQLVIGEKDFLGKITVNRNLECLGDLRHEVIELHETRVITSSVEFTQLVTVIGDFTITGLIDSVDILDLITNAMTNGRTETVTGYWTFAGGVTFKGTVTGSSMLDGHDLGELLDKKKQEALVAEASFESERTYFREQCQLFDRLYQEVAQSPIKLEFFNTHQPTILFKQAIKNIIFVQAVNVSRILTSSVTCEVESYQWDLLKEQFGRPSDASPRLGEVSQWETVMDGEVGILVILSGQSICSSTPGIYFVTMDSRGSYSPKETILNGNFYSIQLVYHNARRTAVLFVIAEDQQTMSVFIWNGVQHIFELKTESNVGRIIQRMKVTLLDDGIGLFYHSNTTVYFATFRFDDFAIVDTGDTLFVAGEVTKTSQSLIETIENGGKHFGFLETRDSVISSECNLQSFELSKTGVTRFERLKSPAVLSMTSIHFGRDEYLALLTKDSGVHIYRYLGLSGFEVVPGSPIRIHHGREIISFMLQIYSYTLPRPFIAVSTGRSIEIFHSAVNGDCVTYQLKEGYCKI